MQTPSRVRAAARAPVVAAGALLATVLVVTSASAGSRGYPPISWTAIGGKLAFTDAAGDIWIAGPGGANARRVTRSGHGSDFDPSWSPDGTSLVFRSTRTLREFSGDSTIRRVSTRTGKEHVFRLPGGGSFPDWSSDGRIAFTGALPFSIKVMRSNGSRLRSLHALGECAEWSPDGRKIAYCSNKPGNRQWDVWMMSSDGTHKRRLTTSSSDERPVGWSADGEQVVVERETAQGSSESLLVRADGSGQRALTLAGRPIAPLAWLPDGRLVFAFLDVRPPGANAVPPLFIANSDGSRMRRLPPLRIVPAGGPVAWYPSSL